jgi:hypothetical protein
LLNLLINIWLCHLLPLKRVNGTEEKYLSFRTD